ncbi:hypothetical protein ACO0QE_001910 [Hanseniaspora vineae]
MSKRSSARMAEFDNSQIYEDLATLVNTAKLPVSQTKTLSNLKLHEHLPKKEAARVKLEAHHSFQEDSPQSKKRKTDNEAGNMMTQYDTVPAESTNSERTTQTAEAGFIKKVILKNFMCHENFYMDLGPGLNFIVGNNGSGKSAILTAISICLGAKATTTNRGNSLKDLIKTGRNQSKIQVVLNNEGMNAFEPETYGNEIIIERVIKKDGLTQYKIRSENMKEVSGKKKTLDKIVDYFSIPVTNPMCFLSQDAARSFLTASTPADKYSHFMKGTLIEETSENHHEIIKKIDSIRNTLQLHQEHVRSLLNDHNAAKSLYQSMRSNVSLLEKKRNLQGKMIWLNVEANERVKEKLTERIQAYEAQIKKCETTIEESNNSISEINAESEELEKELLDIQTELNQKVVTSRNWDAEVKEKINRGKEEQKNVEIAQQDLNNSRRLLEKTSKIYEQKRLQSEKSSDENQNRQREQIERLAHQVEEVEREHSAVASEITDCEEKKASYAEQFSRAKYSITQSIEKNKSELRKISSTDNDIHNSFHPKMKQALHLISQYVQMGSFTSAPIGPLGLYVTIKEEFAKEWSIAIQNSLNKTLRSFVVSNVDDENKLKSILAKFRIEAQIINRKMKTFDYTRDCPQMVHPTIADALTFDNKEVECTFVDLNSIHTVGLIADRNVARNVLKSGIRNLRMVLSIKNQNSIFRSSVYGSSFSVDTINNISPVVTMKTVAQQDYGAYYRSAIQEEEAQLNELNQKHNAQLKEATAELKRLLGQKNNLYNKKRYLVDERTNIELELKKVVDAADLEMLQQQIETQQETISLNERVIEELKYKLAEILEEIAPVERSYIAAKEEQQLVANAYNEKKGLLNKISVDVSNKQDTIVQEQRYITKLKNRIEQYENELETMENGIGKILEAAEAHCSRETAESLEGDTIKEVEEELKRVERQIKISEKSLGMSHEEGRELYMQTKEKFDIARKRVHELEEGVDYLATSVQSRLDALSIALKATCLNADVDFKRSLRFRDFSGSLDFDNEKKALRVFVQTRNDVTARDVDTLSGGEKSYSQISLLLATWKPMKSRVIALDEFDVFMDQVNRTIGTKLLMFKLSSNLRMQTIIITPQDISKIANLEEQKNVQIMRMTDPERQNNSSFYNRS